MSRATQILELYMPDAGLATSEFDKSLYLQTKRSVEKDPVYKEETSGIQSPLLKGKSYQDLPEPHDIRQFIDNMPLDQQMYSIGQLASGFEENNPYFLKKLKGVPPSLRQRIIRAIGAGAFWTAAIYAMPWLGISLLGIRLFQRFKTREGPTWTERIAKTSPRWV